MSGLARTAGVTALGNLAVPVGLFSAIASIGSLALLILVSDARRGSTFAFFIAATAICFFSIRFLQTLASKARTLIEKINKQEGLNLNPQNMLGYPSPAFLVFDKNNRKIAICNTSTEEYLLRDFSYLLSWNYEWTNVNKMQFSGLGNRLPGTTMQAPTFEKTEHQQGFCFVIEVADENNPRLTFPMTEARAKEWHSKFNAIFNV
ncbi:hypothetical protein [Deefgea sp. CFH1-16]|uniref:hypothetical protein n=1 Tax=Deefgea sp. CFH1-16 TaxID=2675457 RepID=UPI0015F541A4|nr:hypothetical protein [Deefgea sp. CFH1-16]MBM5573650.1 hypothetical protein [Deefgea sp. CFH1-16]